jgi:hypothetical protein
VDGSLTIRLPPTDIKSIAVPGWTIMVKLDGANEEGTIDMLDVCDDV